MKKLLPLISFLFIASLTLQGQILFKLEKLADDSGWGVYVKHNGDVATPTDNIDLGSGQVTLLGSTGLDLINLKNVNGIWSQNARVNAPVENPNVDYLDFGYLSSFPNDAFTSDEPILLFTFEINGECPDILELMGLNDPFYAPNSAGNNPTNNFDAIDKGYLPNLYLYGWTDNFQDCPDVCVFCNQEISNTIENLIETNLKIAPNPSNGNFNINLGEVANEVAQISIINNLGQTVFQIKNVSSENEINLDLPNGIYNVLFQQHDKSLTAKRIVISK